MIKSAVLIHIFNTFKAPNSTRSQFEKDLPSSDPLFFFDAPLVSKWMPATDRSQKSGRKLDY